MSINPPHEQVILACVQHEPGRLQPNTEVSKLLPAGQMRLAEPFHPTREAV